MKQSRCLEKIKMAKKYEKTVASCSMCPNCKMQLLDPFCKELDRWVKLKTPMTDIDPDCPLEDCEYE